MFLSQFLKANRAFLFTVSCSRVCLLIFVQALAWYPVLSEKYLDVERQIKRKAQLSASWQKIQTQSRMMEEKDFLKVDWATYSVGDKVQGAATTWQVEGRTLIKEWQVLLEKVQEKIALRLVSASWESEQDGAWHGQLLFDIQEPKRNRAYEDWLPTNLKAGRFIEEDWTLVSTMRIGESASALLKHKDSQHWVRQGSWLPAAGLTVDLVVFDRVTLIGKDGDQVALQFRERREQ
ncbi:hypothetical protein ABFY09_14395 [Marinomonas sp. 5E14-1]|uniref:hypothetical protein n=1 Tax=Marinomonas sp. 5E14-1 TaxID=3153922 RepID=UPI0032656574